MKKSVDIVVLGATGFTGKCVVKMLAAFTKEKYWDITWAIAGRSKEKLLNLSEELSKTGVNFKNLTIIESDINNYESLVKMLDMAKVVINCTGPNYHLSPPVVRACIETGTHYVDISAEMLHILSLHRDYHQLAEDVEVLAIPSCGFSSIPHEIGMVYLEQQFKGTLHSVESYAELLLPIRLPGKTVLHNGTWTSAVYVMETLKKQLVLWKEMTSTVEPEPKEMKKSLFHWHNRRLWFPWPGPDGGLAVLSQKYLNEKTQKKIVHVKEYTTLQYFFQLFIVPVMFLYYYLCYFKCFRKLLINFPRLFTLGLVSEKGPTYKTRSNTEFRITLNGKGWEKNKNSMSVKVSVKDGYDATAIAVIICAITILKDRSKMPKGGVVMPGAAFYNTHIIDRLTENCYKFEVLN